MRTCNRLSVVALFLLWSWCRNAYVPAAAFGLAQCGAQVRGVPDEKNTSALAGVRTEQVKADNGPTGTSQKPGAPVNSGKTPRPEKFGSPVAIIEEAAFRYRHVLDFTGALSVATLVEGCECDSATALRKVAPNEKYIETLRSPAKMVVAAMQDEKVALGQDRSSKFMLFSVTAVISKLNADQGEPSSEVSQHFFLCEKPVAGTARDDRGASMAVIWCGLSKNAMPSDLQATVWLQFLVLPGARQERGARPQPFNVESRRIRFVLKGEKWIKD